MRRIGEQLQLLVEQENARAEHGGGGLVALCAMACELRCKPRSNPDDNSPTIFNGSPSYSYLILPQRQPPVGILAGP